jgi:putative helicase MOV10L1
VKIAASLIPSTDAKGRSKAENLERLFDDLRFRENKGLIVTGERIHNASNNKHVKRLVLPDKKPPQQMYETMRMRYRMVHDIYPVLREQLTLRNYEQKFTTLIQLEEVEFDVNLKAYDMDNKTMSRKSGFLVLDVPGLAEGRPSLLVGDSAICRLRGPGNKKFEGCIHVVEKDDIFLKFNESFDKSYTGDPVNVTFKVSRTTIRRNHYAIENAKKLDPVVLFPQQISFLNTAPLPTPIKWVNPVLNDRQKKAVEWILCGEARPAPYIIFGPPGTGKTVTVVETILQIWKRDPNTRILACAGSNSCADTISQKLISSKIVGKSDMVRLVSFSRSDNVPDNLKPYSATCSEEVTQWLNHRIIVSTCCNAGAIFAHRPLAGHFTHVLIDEAATVNEPESLICILLAAQSGGSIVLVGDPFQLGPVIQSKLAKECGLGVSLLSRIYHMNPYMRDTSANEEHGYYDPRCITKLVESYRCCPQLIQVNSDLFYHSELVCHPGRNEPLLRKMGLNFPILFHGIDGKDLQESDNPSWYNAAEVVEAVRYLMKLYHSGLSADDVGIITPYRKQADKIRQMTRGGMSKAIGKVSTIEDFQGQEREAIILSLVRSNPLHLRHDMHFNLGFLFDAKRFNVSTSRAKSLLIVLGDPFLLQKDECWKQLLKYCILNDAYVGIDFKLNDEDA